MNRPLDRDKQVMDLCERLVGLNQAERNAILDATCADNPALRRDVEELLNSIENSGEFLVLDSELSRD